MSIRGDLFYWVVPLYWILGGTILSCWGKDVVNYHIGSNLFLVIGTFYGAWNYRALGLGGRIVNQDEEVDQGVGVDWYRLLKAVVILATTIAVLGGVIVGIASLKYGFECLFGLVFVLVLTIVAHQIYELLGEEES